MAKASSSSASSVDVVDILGDISIFSSTGESFNFKDLWDPNEVDFGRKVTLFEVEATAVEPEFQKLYSYLFDMEHRGYSVEEMDGAWPNAICIVNFDKGIAVVALLRHFGCPFCWEFANALKEIKPRLDAAGVKLIAIGVGTPNKARLLAERLPFPLDCLYADPDRKAYDILGLYYGFGRTFFNPASVVKVFSRFAAVKKATTNYTIEAMPDDKSGILQQGGMFVFKGKKLLYARKDEGSGDHAPLDDILDICCKVPVV